MAMARYRWSRAFVRRIRAVLLVGRRQKSDTREESCLRMARSDRLHGLALWHGNPLYPVN